jgi:FMN phosphatase YigB (HAD superfamily)
MINKFTTRTALGLFAAIGNTIQTGLSLSIGGGVRTNIGQHTDSYFRRLVLDRRTRISSELLLLSSSTTTTTRRRKHDFVLSESSTLSFAAQEKEEEEDEALARWEQLYKEGKEDKQKQISYMKAMSMMNDNDNDKNKLNNRPIGTHVRVVTFDLDNTLWKTSETISAANDALAIYLSKSDDGDGNPIKVPERIENIMGELFRADRRKYCPLVSNGGTQEYEDEDELEQRCKSPVLLTQLRTDAICHVLETENGFSTERALSFAELAFDVWTQARHGAILDHLAPRVVETLDKIRTTISHNNIPVLMGAVTDGNSDPSRIEALAPYFDFCVNAESVGVSKPDSRVYLEAIRRAVKVSQSKNLSLQKTQEEEQQPHLFYDLIPPEIMNDEDNNKNGYFNIDDIDDETLEGIIGPYWIHIGDDFLKDIVAAKEMKMRTIFAVGLVRDKLLDIKNMEMDDSNKKDAKMDMAEFLKQVSSQVSSQNVLTLEIGASDYLAKSLHGEFVDAVAHDFFDISTILEDWHAEAITSREGEINVAEPSPTSPKPTSPVINAIEPSPTSPKPTTPVINVTEPSPTSPKPASANGGVEELKGILEIIEPSSGSDGLSVTPIAKKTEEGEVDFLLPRAFRIIREDCSMDIPAPLRNREERTMKDVMGMAQKDKSSGVFAFNPDDVASLKDGKQILMIQIGDKDLKFSRETFSEMSVQEVLGLTDENPMKLSLYMTEASEQQSFDLF